MAVAQERGRAGERLAAAYLELTGMSIQASNTRVGGVEVDLVAREGSTLVLVEVKLRGRTDYGGAADAIDVRKRRRLWRAAQVSAGRGHERVRVDVVTVEPDTAGVRIRHYRNAVTE